MFGGLFDKKEKAEYEATIKQMEMQNQIEMQKNMYAMMHGNVTMGNTTLGAQGLTSVSDSGSIILRNMQSDIRELRINIEHISGFYKWIIHAYPETLVQYKALKDLETASQGQDESESYAKSAI